MNTWWKRATASSFLAAGFVCMGAVAAHADDPGDAGDGRQGLAVLEEQSDRAEAEPNAAERRPVEETGGGNAAPMPDPVPGSGRTDPPSGDCGCGDGPSTPDLQPVVDSGAGLIDTAGEEISKTGDAVREGISGVGSGDGSGDGVGNGNGDGVGNGNGDGVGNGDGNGTDNENGDGSGDGVGDGNDGDAPRAHVTVSGVGEVNADERGIRVSPMADDDGAPAGVLAPVFTRVPTSEVGVPGFVLATAAPDAVTILPGGPRLPEQPGTPELPGLPEMPGGPDGPGVPEVPGVPGGPEAPEVPGLPGLPDVPGLPDAPGGGGEPGQPEAPGVPGLPGLPGGPGDVPGQPGGEPGSPSLPGLPGLPEVPGLPDAPALPEIPGDGEPGEGPGSVGLPEVVVPVPGVGSVGAGTDDGLVTVGPEQGVGGVPAGLLAGLAGVLPDGSVDLGEQRVVESAYRWLH